MGPAVQRASIAAWNDEAHVVANRQTVPRASSPQVTPLLAAVLDVGLPDAGFYLWADACRAGGDDVAFARGLLAQYNVDRPARQPARARGARHQPGRRPHPPGAGGRSRRMPRSRPRRDRPCLRTSHRSCHATRMTNDLRTPSTSPGRAAPASRPRTRPRSATRSSRYRRPQRRPHAGRRTTRRRPLDRQPVGQEGGAAVLPAEREPADARRRPRLLRQGADQVRAPRRGRDARDRRARRAAGRGAARRVRRETWS